MKNVILLGAACAALLGASQAIGAEANQNYAKYCALCHGNDGAGKTKVGRMVKAKDLTDPQYQKSFTDDQAVKSITDGMKGEDGRTKMKPFGDKLTPDEAKALIAYVRTLAK